MNRFDEIWKPCPGFEEFYAVSNYGRVKGTAPRAPRGKGAVVGLILRSSVNRDGYSQITLRKDGRVLTRRVHQLVCGAFHGPAPTPKHEAAHWNGVRTDNREGNLRWATRAENQADRSRHGTDGKGSRQSCAKLTEADILVIRGLRSGGLLIVRSPVGTVSTR